jgi:hypothetical protein
MGAYCQSSPSALGCKRMKASNKRVYYAVKYLLIGGLLAVFLATAFA